MKTGRIPSKLFIVVRPVSTYTIEVDEKEFTHAVHSSFAVDAENDKMMEKAREWGTQHGYRKICEESELTYSSTKNDVITDLQLIGLEKRSEGGCAYKVTDAGNHLYDLREDTFLECLYSGEMQSLNGNVYLTSKFVWGVNGTQMRLVRVGSKLHKQLIEAGERKKLSVLKKKDLVAGTVYQMRSGEERAYLGDKKGKGMLVCDLAGGQDKTLSLQERLNLIIKKRPWRKWRLRYTRSHSFVKAIGTIKIPEGIHEELEVRVNLTH